MYIFKLDFEKLKIISMYSVCHVEIVRNLENCSLILVFFFFFSFCIVAKTENASIYV